MTFFDRTKKALTLAEYNQFLDTIAKNKKVDVAEIKSKLTSAGPPSTTKTTVSNYCLFLFEFYFIF